jgi:hypothetical protein
VAIDELSITDFFLNQLPPTLVGGISEYEIGFSQNKTGVLS